MKGDFKVEPMKTIKKRILSFTPCPMPFAPCTMQVNRRLIYMKNIKKIFLSAAMIFSFMTGFAQAETISDYTAYPPFLPRVVSPNILFILDYSKAMVRPAYGTCTEIKDLPETTDKNSWLSNCTTDPSLTSNTFSNITDDYSSTTPYEGYFGNGYSGSGSYTDADAYTYYCDAGANCQKATTSPGSGWTGPFNANWLNWLTMTQFDVMKKVFAGGDLTNAPEGGGDPSKLKSLLSSGVTMRKTLELKSGDTNSNGILDYCEGKVPSALCTQWPSVSYSWASTPSSSSATVPAPANKYNLIFGSTNVLNQISTAQSLPFRFTFYGNTYTDIYISTNGYITFTNPGTTVDSYSSNEDIYSASSPNNIIAPLWDYLEVESSRSSAVKTFTEGSSPSRIYHIRYENMYHILDTGKADPLIFDILLYEGSNHIVFQYKEVDSTQGFGEGKSATIGVENSDGTAAKKKSYCATSCTSDVVANLTAIFATPHITFNITTSSSKETKFQPAAPIEDTSSAGNDFFVNILIKGVAKVDGACPVGSTYNKDKDSCYDHDTVGLFHEFRDAEFSGTLGFRIAFMIQGIKNGSDGGDIGGKGKYFNKKETSTLMTTVRGLQPTELTPLSEALYQATRYFRQVDPQVEPNWGSEFSLASTTVCDSSNTDPYCFPSAKKWIECCKSFVLLISSGNYSNDFRGNIFNDTLLNAVASETNNASDDIDITTLTDACKTIVNTSGNCTATDGNRINYGWLDNVAYYAHTTDLRPGIEGTQNLTIYTVNTFGISETTLSNNISSTDTTINVASTSGFPSVGKIQIDSEIINYTGKTSTSLTGCTRGADSTTAASHSSGVTVYQAPVNNGTNVLKRTARYGGFTDKTISGYTDNVYDKTDTNGNGTCDSGETWEDDVDCDGIPDTYFAATSEGGDIQDKIEDAVSAILKSSASGTSVSVLSTSAGGEGAIYQAYFYPAKVEGTTEERTWPGYLRTFFLDKYQNMRDDASGGTYNVDGTYSGTPDKKLIMAEDYVTQMYLNATTNEVKVNLISDDDGILPSSPSIAGTISMDQIASIWEGGKKLALRDKGDSSSPRNIFTWLNDSGTGGTTTGLFSSNTGTPKDFKTSEAANLRKYLRAVSDSEASNIIDFIRGNVVTGFRNRCISINPESGENTETGCAASTESGKVQRVWALGDIVYSTPTLVGSPGEQYDQIYGDSSYKIFRKQYKNRRRMVYTGANDGMLHAFNAGVYASGDDNTTDSIDVSGRFTDNPTGSDGIDSDGDGSDADSNGWGSAKIGEELWAFIPYDNLPHLAWLACNGTDTDPSVCGDAQYTHVYYVDQRPKVTDVKIFNNDATHPDGWGTILIMPMRLGGGAIDVDLNGDSDTLDAGENFRSAFYVFDITDPEQKPKLLWRFYTTGLGFTTSYPAIAHMHDLNSDGDTSDTGENKWYMVVGSGHQNEANSRDYNGVNTTQAGKVFIVDIADGTLKKTIQAEASNAIMGDATVVDGDLNYASDVIYIGSSISATSGRLYRINTKNTTPSDSGTNWILSTLFDPNPSKIDPDPDNNEDMGPLLISPSVSKDSRGNLWVFFGTGRLRSTNDRTDTSTLDENDLTNSDKQRFYGIKDACWKGTCSDTYNTIVGDTNSLTDVTNLQVCTKLSGGGVYDETTGNCSSTTYSSYQAMISSMRSSSSKGWYLDLSKTDPSPSEKVLSRSVVLGGLVLFTTYKPTDMCSIFGDSRLYALYYETGTAYINPVLPIDSSTSVTVSKSMDLGKGMPTAVGVAIGETVTGFVQKSTGEIVRIETEPGLDVRSGAASWKEKTGGGGTIELEEIYKHIVK